jgi:hypothetical protein
MEAIDQRRALEQEEAPKAAPMKHATIAMTIRELANSMDRHEVEGGLKSISSFMFLEADAFMQDIISMLQADMEGMKALREPLMAIDEHESENEAMEDE